MVLEIKYKICKTNNKMYMFNKEGQLLWVSYIVWMQSTALHINIFSASDEGHNSHACEISDRRSRRALQYNGSTLYSLHFCDLEFLIFCMWVPYHITYLITTTNYM